MPEPSNQPAPRLQPANPGSEKPSPAELYRRAEALVPILAGRAMRCEELRHCPPESIDDLAAAGLLQLCRPARYGGYEYGWDVLSEVNRILARGCGSQAWVANVLNGDTQLVGAFPLEAQDDFGAATRQPGSSPASRLRAAPSAWPAAPSSPAVMASPAASIMPNG